MLTILRAGIQTTVQDLGRPTGKQYGISQCGALDPYALQIANVLVGNEANANCLEFTLGPIEITFNQPTVVALSGTGFIGKVHRQGNTIDTLYSHWRTAVLSGDTLVLNNNRHGTRAYLAVQGGFLLDDIFNSGATDLNNHFGGLEGRALKDQDTLNYRALNLQSGALSPSGVQAFDTQTNADTVRVRAIPGPEYHDFSAKAKTAFWAQPWSISSNSNRMAIKLLNETLFNERPKQLFSHAVFPGVIQVPPDGHPIVLLADAQTTGGYPRLASVIEADIPKLVQAGYHRQIQFVETTIDEAIAAKKQWQHYINHLKQTLAKQR